MYYICYIFLFFIGYSILGYIAEVISCTIESKKLTLSRGFLIGPYLPIYGVGATIMVVMLNRFKNNIFLLFIMSVLLCTILEYLTSYVMEKLLKLRWWDYSEEKYQLNGRICLKNSLLFGIAGVFVVYVMQPFYVILLNTLENKYILFITIIFLIIFLIDYITSVYIIIRFRGTVKEIKKQDSTKEIKDYVKKTIRSHRIFFRRLIKAFPNITKKELKEYIEFIKRIGEKRSDD